MLIHALSPILIYFLLLETFDSSFGEIVFASILDDDSCLFKFTISVSMNDHKQEALSSDYGVSMKEYEFVHNVFKHTFTEVFRDLFHVIWIIIFITLFLFFNNIQRVVIS